MDAIIISHLAGTEPARFEVIRSNGQRALAVEVPSPYQFPVQERPNDHLMGQLRWYLEDFLDYPFPPRTDQATYVEEALKAWGTQAFDALFQSGKARDWFIEARRRHDGGAQPLRLQISSDDPAVLSWPWEALNDPETGVLAYQTGIERRLNYNLPDPPPLSEQLPRDRIHILLVTARPYEGDVQYRSISRPLVDLIKREKLPAVVDLLRPPTFDQLREHLRKHPHRYHILHFDGHGAYHPEAIPGGHAEMFKPGGVEGQVVFEDKEGKAHAVSAGELSDLLREQAVPLVVLNACQSAMLDAEAREPFASVAAALLRTGIRSVVAMSYSVTLTGAREFLPPFYRALFQSGDVAEAVRRGRQEMRAHGQRSRLNPALQLQDWLVPVVYQQEPVELTFTENAEVAPAPAVKGPAPGAEEEHEAYSFVGRDGAFLELERALGRKPTSILIHGLGGIGKTRLARVFLRWLGDTGGLGEGWFWFTFNAIRSAPCVFNDMGRALLGPQFGAGSVQQSLDQLVAVLWERRFIIVWDNFESVRGNPEAGVSAMLPEADQNLLLEFVVKLRGGASKVIITSRGEEEWLGPQNCFGLRLGGLHGEDVWDFAAQILDDLGLTVDRKNPELGELLRGLGGHPLAMQAVLVQLRQKTPAQARAALEGLLTGKGPQADPTLSKLNACLDFVRGSLPTDLQPFLVPLSLYEEFADVMSLQQMTEDVRMGLQAEGASQVLEVLGVAGLVHDIGGGVLFQLHPLLTSYLRSRARATAQQSGAELWIKAFVGAMGNLANTLVPKELRDQRKIFRFHGSNLYRAAREAERLKITTSFMALIQFLASFAFHTRNLVEAQRLYQRLAEESKKADWAEAAGVAYHQLGRVLEEQRQFAQAIDSYSTSLAIKEKRGDEHGAASTYHQLGRIAEEQRDFAGATRWYLKAVEVFEKQADDPRAAMTYHQLGIIAQEQKDFAQAQHWFGKSMKIKQKQGDEHGAATSYHHFGMIAEAQSDFAQAEQWYLKALEIKEKRGDERGAAGTYHQLGINAQKQGKHAQAKRWYFRSLAISEKHGDESGAATTYHNLGVIAQQERDFAQARQWYSRSLEIKQNQGDEHGAAIIWCLLGIIEREQGNHAEAGRWFIKAASSLLKRNDLAMSRRAVVNFLVLLRSASAEDQAQLRAMWQEAGLPSLLETNKPT